MRILMLGNSLTLYNELPALLADLTGAEVIAHTRGGARLAEQLNPETQLGAQTLTDLEKESWDYVILQEMSNGPVTAKTAFLESAGLLCDKIRQNGAVPVFYATWAYCRGSEMLEKSGFAYEVMAALLSAAYHEAAEQNDALIADVGQAFFRHSETEKLYSADGCHPSVEGTMLAAKTIAEVIEKDQKEKHKVLAVETMPEISPDDPRLRLLYMYQMLLKYTDPDHPLSTNQIRQHMLEEHGISMHRTTVPVDVALLQAAGVPVQARRSRVMLYNMEEMRFELAELKVLIDAVESSKFITEKKSRELVEKLTRLTSTAGAENLKRNLHTSGRVRSGNEKGYYIVDAINQAINDKLQISFLYTDYNEKKQLTLRNNGQPYTVSPYTLMWNGDYYYLVGWYHEKKRISTFRVDRILTRPDILSEAAMPAPEKFDINRYTREVFRMFDNEKTRKVTLVCDNSVMKGIIDQFGPDVIIKHKDKNHFIAKVRACTSPTFYGWVFQWGGQVRITAPKAAVEEYREMARKVLEQGG